MIPSKNIHFIASRNEKLGTWDGGQQVLTRFNPATLIAIKTDDHVYSS